MPDPHATVSRWTADVAVPGHTYPRPLPADLEPWYCYVADGGHSILVAVRRLYQPGRGEDEFSSCRRRSRPCSVAAGRFGTGTS